MLDACKAFNRDNLLNIVQTCISYCLMCSLSLWFLFNDFFVNVGKNLAGNIESIIDPLKYIANNVYSINTIEITEDKIINIISAMKNSAAGFDELPAFIMKQCSKFYIKPLCHVLSLSIRQGVFPNELKLAKVLPIYKSDDKRQLKNYRPISVLPFISKIFEKIVAD